VTELTEVNVPEFFTSWEGERPSPPKTPGETDTLHEQALAAEELLGAALSQSDTWLETLRWKAMSAQRLQFAGQMLPLLGGAAFLTQLSEQSGWVRDLLGLMTFLGSIVVLWARHTERTLAQGHAASELLPQLVEVRAQGERLRRELRVWRHSGQDRRLGLELIDKAHPVAHRLHTLGPLVGESPWRRLLLRIRAPRLQAPKSTR
jgi:hypothetical protein